MPAIEAPVISPEPPTLVTVMYASLIPAAPLLMSLPEITIISFTVYEVEASDSSSPVPVIEAEVMLPLPSTVSIVIVASLAGVVPPNEVPKTVNVSVAL